MSYLLTAVAIDQSADNVTMPTGDFTVTGGALTMTAGDVNMTAGSVSFGFTSGQFVGITGTGGLIEFDSSNNAVKLGPGSSTRSGLLFNSTSESVVLDSGANTVLEFATATTSPTDHLKITPGNSSAELTLSAESTGSDADMILASKGTGTVIAGGGVASFAGLAIAGGSVGAARTILKSGLATGTDTLTLPNTFVAGDLNKVLKATAAASGAITLGFAADAGALTYNDQGSSAFNSSTLAVNNVYGINDLASSVTATLPGSSASSDGDQIRVIDSNGGASASATITLTAGSGSTINGAASFVLDGAYQAVTLQYNATTAKYNII